MSTIYRLAVAAALVVLSFATPADALKTGETIDLECPHPDGSKWRVHIDLDAEAVLFSWVDSKDHSPGWQGPNWAMMHEGGWISWYGGTADSRTYWMLERSSKKLEAEISKGGGCCGGACCSARPIEMTSILAHCSTTKKTF
jgi:hypothetical protein